MAAKEFPLSVVIRAIDRVTAPMRGIQNAVRRFDQRIGASARGLSEKLGLPAMTAATQRLGTAMGDLGARAGRVLTVIGAIGAGLIGLGVFAGKSLIDTASTFEKYQTVLETIEGSQAKAAKSIQWVSEFAAKTPYELDEVMDSFVKLRAYGIDPTNGTLRVLGDTSAAMGKPIMQAVEAIADAMTGENERLKEFGIRASKQGDKIVYEYSKDGKTMRKVADASNRAMIQATLMAIWNDRYSGAMDKLSGTWGGMMSNLSDQWQRFKLMIMQSGPFEQLRKRLAGLLERIDAMAKSGELQRLAEAIGTWLVEKFDKLWATGEKLVKNWDDIQAKAKPFTNAIEFLTEKFGTMNVIIGVVAGILIVTLVPAIYATATAFYALGVAIMTTPIGWIAAAILVLSAAILYFSLQIEDGQVKLTKFGKVFLWLVEHMNMVLIWKAMWDHLMGTIDQAKVVFSQLWENIKEGFGNAMQSLRDFASSLSSMIPDWAKNLFGGGSASLNVTGGQAAAAAAPAKAAAVGAAPVGAAAAGAKAAAAQQGNVRVQVDMNGLPPGARVTTQESGTPQFELNQGYAFGS